MGSTLIYARAHDQTVADDYFAAMERVEQRLELVPAEQKDMEVVKVQEPEKLIQLVERLESPELCLEERLDIASQLRQLLGKVNAHAPPEKTKTVAQALSVLSHNSCENLSPNFCENHQR